MMIFWEPPYDPKMAKQKRKLKEAWTKFVTPTWQGGQQKMNLYISKKVKKGVMPSPPV
jgi:hypothetical protein